MNDQHPSTVPEAVTETLLIDASERLAGAHSMTDVVEVLRDTARAAIGAEGIAIVQREGDQCFYVAEDAISPLWQGKRFDARSCISGWAMQHLETVAIADISSDFRIPQEAYAPTFVRSLAIAPIGNPEAIGALGAYWSAVGAPTPEAVERLGRLARLAAIAIEKAQLIEARDRAASLATAQSRILERVVRDAPLRDNLEAITRAVEDASTSGVLASILILDEDGAHLCHGAGPSLPDAYNEAIDGIAVGEAVGSCGTAVHRGEPVIVADIATDPLWADFRDLALGHDLRSCWSTPIRGGSGTVLGTFAMYHRAPRTPLPGDLEIVDFVVRTAGLVIERGRTEAAMLRSDARYRQIVEGTEEFAIVTLDNRGVITGWNTGAERTMGWSAEQAIGQPGAMFFTPEDRLAGAPDHEMNRARSDGRAVNERWHIRQDGSRFWGSGLMMPLAMDHAGYVKMFRDRTVEHEAEAALRESERELRFALEAGRFGAWRLNLASGEMTSSKTCRTNFGRDPELPFSYEELRDAVHPDDKERMVAAVAESVTTGATYDIEYRIVTPSGAERWVQIRAQPLLDSSGRAIEMAGVSIDITERKRAEQHLIELNDTLERRVAEALAERRVFADVIEKSTAPMLAIDYDYRITAINAANVDAFERAYGPRPKLGDNLLALLDDQPEHREQVAAAFGRALAGEEYVLTADFGEGERLPYEVRFHLLLDAGGRQVGAFQTAFDVSARVRAEAELAQAQEALRQSQKMEAMGQLTGGVAHDFNNLLTPIVGGLDMLQRRGLGNEREQRLIGGAMQSAERAKTLVQRLLAFARRQPLQTVSVDLKALLDGMAGLIGSTVGPRIDLRVDVPGDLPAASADPNQLEMAILNLGVNARDAMTEGGTLTIEASSEHIVRGHRSGLRDGDYVRVSVGDTGKGMDEATLARAVEPFFSTKGIGKGTGLGLSMVHGLVAQLGGGLSIESRPGAGTTVSFWLPVGSGSIANEEAAAQPADRPRRGRALLVDDEELVRMSTADMLIDLGFEVVEASSAEDALQVLATSTPDVIVTDHLMPGMTGTELARQARATDPALPVLIVSGYAEVEGIAPDLPRLVKPFRAAELVEQLAAILPERRKSPPVSETAEPLAR